jgi:hypothetical protein
LSDRLHILGRRAGDVAHETLKEAFMRRWLLPVLLLLSSAACATARTRIAPVAPERVRAEESRQREIVLHVMLGHEIAHNAMHHVEARKSNAVLGALFGALGDIALAANGVNTGGYYASEFAKLGAKAYSQDFEREADYVGLYILARAGIPLENAPMLWRHFAQIDPMAIAYASTHPTTAERFVLLEATMAEIEWKRRRGEGLVPEWKRREP